ncbi:MAG: DUF1292 domain-containing protein [Lactobacillaceae bacterium]|jgi:uncharacterized protein YrzB (UPF0473 family)|nr:DUF1292 domain-containing protein [Lactobacillaceae bacterium]
MAEKNLQFTLLDEEDQEYIFEELFRFVEDEKFHKTYIVIYETTGEPYDTEVQAFVYDEALAEESPEAGLLPIETDAEWEMVAEMMDTYFDDPLINE